MKLFFLAWLALTFAGPLWLLLTNQVDLEADYRTANRESANIAPLPAEHDEAVIQFYAARAFSWRGLFASHSWIATKAKGADSFTVYQVVGWNSYRGLPALTVTQDIPDRSWYGAAPNIYVDLRGPKAQQLIEKIEQAAKDYPHADEYRVWPGPNSNTFPAYVARRVPELGLAMPADAVGKDLLVGENKFFARAPSGTGYQLSFYGMLGILVAKKEGIELNLLGLTYGIRFSPFKIVLPGFG